jgi:hypothetical protein
VTGFVGSAKNHNTDFGCGRQKLYEGKCRSRSHGTRLVKPVSMFVSKDGPFTDFFNGTMKKSITTKTKEVRVSVTFFSVDATPVELDFSQIERRKSIGLFQTVFCACELGTTKILLGLLLEFV